jgi:hypothetical protein
MLKFYDIPGPKSRIIEAPGVYGGGWRPHKGDRRKKP